MNEGKITFDKLLSRLILIIMYRYRYRTMVDPRTVDLTKNLAPTVKILMDSFEDRYDDIVNLLDMRLTNYGVELKDEEIAELADYYISGVVNDG